MTKNFKKVVDPNRKLCYCMATIHELVSNCLKCGKIVCKAEGKGPCMFCGTWVDNYIDVTGEDSYRVQAAVDHRDRLIEYDENSTQRLGIKDQRADWFELENDTWQR